MKIRNVFVFSLVILSIITDNAYSEIPDHILNAVITVESSNRPWVESKDGCRGLGQIKKETWYWLCKLNNKSWSFDEAFDPEKNKVITRSYLEWLKIYLEQRDRFSWDLLFACYNAGPGTVRKYGWQVPPYTETRNYINRINTLLAAG